MVRTGGFSVQNNLLKDSDLLNKYELLNIFYNLVSIPSPSKKEEDLIEWIKGFCQKEGINFRQDSYGNVYLKVDATDTAKQPFAFSAHMDVVGDNSPVIPKLDGDFIYVGDRTLGADDKAGVACSLLLAKRIKNSDLKHGGFEAIFTRDEESGMSGIEHVEFDKINSKYVMVLDADKMGQLQISGAGYIKLQITVEGLLGGHSGIDIQEKDRLNAMKLISELVSELPQGVYYADESGVITSCNAGALVAGGVKPSNEYDIKTSKNFIDSLIDNAATNVINTYAKCSYSIRSASIEKQEELKKIFVNKVNEFNEKYKNLAVSRIEFIPHLLPFEKANDDLIAKHHTLASEKAGVKNEISSFHAAAETHIYCQKTNANGVKLMPFLLGTADVYNMHSEREKVDYKSFLKGYEVIENLFYSLNE